MAADQEHVPLEFDMALLREATTERFLAKPFKEI